MRLMKKEMNEHVIYGHIHIWSVIHILSCTIILKVLAIEYV